MKRRLLIALLFAAMTACLEDPGLEEGPFPCRAPEDCVDGFSCHPERYVCVPAGEVSVDAGVTDAG